MLGLSLDMDLSKWRTALQHFLFALRRNEADRERKFRNYVKIDDPHTRPDL